MHLYVICICICMYLNLFEKKYWGPPYSPLLNTVCPRGEVKILFLFLFSIWSMVIKMIARIPRYQCKKPKLKTCWWSQDIKTADFGSLDGKTNFYGFWSISRPHKLLFSFGFLHCFSLISVVILNMINHSEVSTHILTLPAWTKNCQGGEHRGSQYFFQK